MSCCPPPCCPSPCCPPPCCPPPCCGKQETQKCTVQLPPLKVVCKMPPPQSNNNSSCGQKKQSCCPPPPCCPPPSCCPSPCCPPSCCPSPCCPQPMTITCCAQPCPTPCCKPAENDGGCKKRERREKRFPQCNFLKPCIDGRIYRNGEYMCISYAGHIPGEQFISGRNLPTTTTFAKRRLCQFTPYEFVDPDGCCSNCVFHG